MATDKLVDFDHVTDYISREAAIDAVDVGNLHHGIIDALQDIISEIPAADVRPVVRGEWTRVDYEPCGHDYICSECGCKSAGAWNFCPNCGADMRETGNG